MPLTLPFVQFLLDPGVLSNALRFQIEWGLHELTLMLSIPKDLPCGVDHEDVAGFRIVTKF